MPMGDARLHGKLQLRCHDTLPHYIFAHTMRRLTCTLGCANSTADVRLPCVAACRASCTVGSPMETLHAARRPAAIAAAVDDATQLLCPERPAQLCCSAARARMPTRPAQCVVYT